MARKLLILDSRKPIPDRLLGGDCVAIKAVSEASASATGHAGISERESCRRVTTGRGRRIGISVLGEFGWGAGSILQGRKASTFECVGCPSRRRSAGSPAGGSGSRCHRTRASSCRCSAPDGFVHPVWPTPWVSKVLWMIAGNVGKLSVVYEAFPSLRGNRRLVRISIRSPNFFLLPPWRFSTGILCSRILGNRRSGISPILRIWIFSPVSPFRPDAAVSCARQASSYRPRARQWTAVRRVLPR